MAQNKKNNKKKAPKWDSNIGQEVVKSKADEYFLMLTKKVDAKDIIAALKEREFAGLDLWEALSVFSLEPKEGECVEFAELNIEETFVDNSDLAFIKNREIHTIFSFEAEERQIEALKPYLKAITELFGGFACGDSDDFQPMISC